MLFKLVYFAPYLTRCNVFFDHCGLLKLRHLNYGHIVNPEQVRSQTFWVNNVLLYMLHKELMLSQ
jgi:hypothetical protein